MVTSNMSIESLMGLQSERKAVNTDKEFDRVRKAADKTRSRITTAFSNQPKIPAQVKQVEA